MRLLPAEPNPRRQEARHLSTTSELISAARSAARWLESRAQRDGEVAFWPDARASADGGRDCSLYRGAAGIAFFLYEVFLVTQDESYLRLADAAGRGLIATATITPKGLLWQRNGKLDLGLYTGSAGVAGALLALFEATHEEHYLHEAQSVFTAIVERNARSSRWNGSNDVLSGAAGIGLALIRANIDFARQGLRSDLLDEQAIMSGQFLLEQARTDDAGCWWHASEADQSIHYPNFSHGTAGIGYFLATLYEYTRDRSYLQHAVAAANWLVAHGKKPALGGVCFHHDSSGKRLYYLGWCHGPVGTSRLFYKLYKITGEERWLEIVKNSARWLQQIGIFTRPHAGLWNLGMCCGIAGIGDFFANLTVALGATNYARWVEGCAECLLQCMQTGENGSYWVQAEHRHLPLHREAAVGYSQGVAGIGTFLVRAAQVLSLAEQTGPRLPDDPFNRAADREKY